MKSKQIKQRFGIILIGLFLLMGTSCLYGQSYNQSMLMNREWVCRLPGKNYYSIEFFTDNERISKLFVDDVKADVELNNSYYLSDEVVDTFQPDSVGKNKTGKYIVTLMEGKNGDNIVYTLNIAEILELTDTTLKTNHVQSGTILEFKIEEGANQ